MGHKKGTRWFSIGLKGSCRAFGYGKGYRRAAAKTSCAWNKPKGYLRRLRQFGDDGPPSREGIKRRWEGGTKYLNEHLGPLRRYLDSQVGRPWNKVFSEICAHISRNSAVQDHVRDHVSQYVAVHVILIDGVPCCGEGNRSHGMPLRSMFWRPWYVCPRSGLLKRIKPPNRNPSRRCARTGNPKDIRVSDELQCRFIRGAWYLVTLRPLPILAFDRRNCVEKDVLLDRSASEIPPEMGKKLYGAPVFAVAIRRLGKRELPQYPIPAEYW